MRALTLGCLALVLGMSPAFAHSECTSLAKIKADFDKADKGTRFTRLTPGQFNFARGGYIATPPIDGKLPEGDAAVLATHAGQKGGVILWLKGQMVCLPTPVPQEFINAMKGVKTGPVDSEGEEI